MAKKFRVNGEVILFNAHIHQVADFRDLAETGTVEIWSKDAQYFVPFIERNQITKSAAIEKIIAQPHFFDSCFVDEQYSVSFATESLSALRYVDGIINGEDGWSGVVTGDNGKEYNVAITKSHLSVKEHTPKPVVGIPNSHYR